ncbi:PTS sugar transporter subunit IIA [Desulfobacter latus]|uniref:PTS sugar transporter subunit IIA n=1 Tax=Desulfobacter latus TaxID=2292 RepID=A0A850T0L3_9BACT|nr:PTS sugar transporter subunit IIA [Desulfobacter latus]NWH05870.1 PTS sugar transporter subunit IIA [Desulfobacter latus]
MEILISELCKSLGVSRTTIERWIRQGKLPVSQKGRTYSFHARDLKNWAAKNHISLNLTPRPAQGSEAETPVSLHTALKTGGVYHDIDTGPDVPSVINTCVKKIKAVPDDFKADLTQQLLEREKALSTGLGGGIAIPHPRIPLDYIEHPMVAACFLKTPVDYHALDNQPVSTLFFILFPELKFHLHLLSALSLCLRNRQFSEFLKTRPKQSELIEKIDTLHLTQTM